MKCFCITCQPRWRGTVKYYPNREYTGTQRWIKIDYDGEIIKTVMSARALKSRVEHQNDCGKCKHRLTCLVDPECDRKFQHA